ncbi:type II secretion system GspH family protein [bacterium 210820-DFI.6.52]|nr:type II secretion system GspH family protein [bacterium 210820-DFI.6.52]
MRAKPREQGSAMLWSVLVLAIIAIFATGVLTLALSFSQRSIQNDSRQQAYLTARSAVDALSSQLHGLEAGQSSELVPTTPEGIRVEIPQTEGMGSCTAVIARPEEGVITITATARYGSQEQTVVGRLTREGGGDGDLPVTDLSGFVGFVGGRWVVSGQLELEGDVGDEDASAMYVLESIVSGSQKGHVHADVPPVLAPGYSWPKGVGYDGKNREPLNQEITAALPQLTFPDEGAQTLPAGAWRATLGGGQQWYQFEGSTSPSVLTITGDQDIYIRVRQGQKLYLSKIERDEDDADVQVFVLLEEGASGPGGVFQPEYGFENPDNAPLYLCGGAGTKVDLGGATELTGSIYCTGEVATGHKTELEYRPPIAGSTGEEPGGGAGESSTFTGMVANHWWLGSYTYTFGTPETPCDMVVLQDFREVGSQNRVVTYRAPIVKSGATGAGGNTVRWSVEPQWSESPAVPRPRLPSGPAGGETASLRLEAGGTVEIGGEGEHWYRCEGGWQLGATVRVVGSGDCYLVVPAGQKLQCNFVRPATEGDARVFIVLEDGTSPWNQTTFETAYNTEWSQPDNLNLYVLGGAETNFTLWGGFAGAAYVDHLQCNRADIQFHSRSTEVGRPVAPSSGRWKLVRYEAA